MLKLTISHNQFILLSLEKQGYLKQTNKTYKFCLCRHFTFSLVEVFYKNKQKGIKFYNQTMAEDVDMQRLSWHFLHQRAGDNGISNYNTLHFPTHFLPVYVS